MVIQIDTDRSQISPFSVPHTKIDSESKSIVEKSVEELYNDVVQKLKGLIRPEVLLEVEGRIFFAICIHTIECWLLPIYCSNSHKSEIKNCQQTLNAQLRIKNIKPLLTGRKNSHESQKTYDSILSNWRKKKDIVASAKHNPSFKLFVDSLEGIDVS